MLTEIIIYVVLFSVTFSGAFGAAFQTIDSIQYLQRQKMVLDSTYYLSAKLDEVVYSTKDWRKIDLFVLPVSVVSKNLINTSTSTNAVLRIKVLIQNKEYTFSYVRQK